MGTAHGRQGAGQASVELIDALLFEVAADYDGNVEVGLAGLESWG
jgi:hypothetical protein